MGLFYNVCLAVFVANGSFLFGYDSAVINGATSAMQGYFGVSAGALGSAVASALLGAAAVGLWRLSPWSRGPVVFLQLLLGLFGWYSAFEWGGAWVGVPILVLVATELYLLATPEARLAFLER